ncbi:unnamed protein product, partial [Staurois parvus]
GHRWAELVGALLGTGGRNLRVALLGTDHQGTDHHMSRGGAHPSNLCCHSVRKVLLITDSCHRGDRH